MTLVLLYYLGWSYLRQTELEMWSFSFFFFFFLSAVVYAPLSSWKSGPISTHTYFKTYKYGNQILMFRAFSSLFTQILLKNPWDKKECCSHRWNLFSLATCRLLWYILVWNSSCPKGGACVNAVLRGETVQGRMKTSLTFFRIQLCPENRYFTPVPQHINTRQMCGKPNSLRSLSWKRKRHDDLKATSAALAAASVPAAGGKFPASTASRHRVLEQLLRQKPKGTKHCH